MLMLVVVVLLLLPYCGLRLRLNSLRARVQVRRVEAVQPPQIPEASAKTPSKAATQKITDRPALLCR